MKKFTLLFLCILIVCTEFVFAATIPADTVCMKVGPNPTRESLNLYPNTAHEFTVQLCDAAGYPIGNSKYVSGTRTINMKDLASGLYFLKVTFAQKPPMVFKIVKTK